MSRHYNNDPVSRSYERSSIDEGLRSYMVRVYGYMAMGLLLTALVSLGVASQPDVMMAMFSGGLRWVVMLAPLGVVFFLSARLHAIKLETAKVLFWVYSALVGLSISFIFVVYKMQSIASLFFVTSSVFGAMSIYGYTTRKDLTSMGSFLMMGLIGIVIAGLVNMFLHSSALQMVISVIGVLVFTGLTAYDVQNIKESYDENDGMEIAGKKAVFGALQLYLDFINLFLSLLRLFGDRRD